MAGRYHPCRGHRTRPRHPPGHPPAEGDHRDPLSSEARQGGSDRGAVGALRGRAGARADDGAVVRRLAARTSRLPERATRRPGRQHQPGAALPLRAADGRPCRTGPTAAVRASTGPASAAGIDRAQRARRAATAKITEGAMKHIGDGANECAETVSFDWICRRFGACMLLYLTTSLWNRKYENLDREVLHSTP